MNIFEQATRRALRFDTAKGGFTVEDLWDLPLQSAKNPNLDDIARGLFKQLKSGDDVSFVSTATKSDETIQLKFDIVKYIIDTKIAENEVALNARKNADQKQQLLAILAENEQAGLRALTPDELRARIAALG